MNRITRLATYLFIATLLLACLPMRQTRRTVTMSTSLSTQWTFSTKESINHPPIISGNMVLVQTNTQIIALDAKTGKQVWEFSANLSGFPFDFDLHDQYLAFASNTETTINVISMQDGKTVWEKNIGGFFIGQISRVALDEEKVYVALGRPGNIFAFDLLNGNKVWASTSIPWNVAHLALRGNKLLAFQGGTLLILDTKTGTIEKKTEPLFDGEWDYLLLTDNDLCLPKQRTTVCRDLPTGQVHWQLNENLRLYSVVGDMMFASSESGTLVSLDKATGYLLWRHQLDAVPVSPVTRIENSGFVLLANASILEFDLMSGREIGKITTAPQSVGPYRLAEGLNSAIELLFATFGDNTLIAFGK